MDVKCSCFFCKKNKAHPNKKHATFCRIAYKTIPLEACMICGHKRKVKVENGG